MKCAAGYLFFICAVFFRTALAGDKSEHVVDLTASTFSEYLEKKQEGMLVMFYAPWCSHCQAFEPDYKVAAKKLFEKGSPVVLARVDATQETELASKYNVKAYPTLIFFRFKQNMEFNGVRSQDGVLEYVSYMTGPSIVETDSKEKALEEAKKNRLSFVAGFSSKDTEAYKMFETHADKFRGTGVFIAYIAPDVKESEESITAVREGEEPCSPQIFKTMEDIASFCKNESLPLFGPINARNFESYYRSGYDLVWFVGSKEDYEAATSVMRTTAKQLRDKFRILWLSTTDFPGHAQSALGLASFPSMVVQINDSKYVYPQNNFSDSEDIVNFLKNASDGKIERHIRSEEIPEENDGVVTIVVAKNFDEMVLRKDKDVILMVYAPWCGHCKSLEPVYLEFAQKMENQENLFVAKLDGAANESPNSNFKWEGFPTIFFVKAGETTPVVFSGERTVEALKAFVAQHGSTPIYKSEKAHDEL